MSMCTECDTNTISTDPGAIVCTECNPGTVPNGKRSECGEFRVINKKTEKNPQKQSQIRNLSTHGF